MPIGSARVSAGRLSGLSAAEIQALGRLAVRIGIFEDSTYSGEGDTPPESKAAKIASYHEFGAPGLPARPFMRPTVAAKKNSWAKKLRVLLRREHLQRQSVSNAFEVIGQVAARDMQETIEKMNTPALAAETVARKKRRGKQHPEKLLVDTGTMQEAISFEVTNE